MDMGLKCGLMEAHMKENGSIILRTEKAFSHVQMATIIKEMLKMENHMEVVN